MGQKRPFIQWSLSMKQSTQLYIKKKQEKTFKNNLEKQYLGNLTGS